MVKQQAYATIGPSGVVEDSARGKISRGAWEALSGGSASDQRAAGIGSDSWRKLGGPVCDNRRLVRQDLLDQIVWAEVIRLLEDPTLIQQELDRRLAAARSSDPTKKYEQNLQRELIHVGKGIERLLNA